MTLDELVNILGKQCKCGHDMELIINEVGRCTGRRCTNPKCPYHMSKRAVYVLGLLNVKGVGEKTALNVIQSMNCSNHIQAAYYMVGQNKFQVGLPMYLRMLDFEGIDGAWEGICTSNDIWDPVSFLTYYGQNMTDDMVQLFGDCLQYVDIIRPAYTNNEEVLKTVYIMITGNPRKYPDKDYFVGVTNHIFNDIIRVYHIPHKRKSNVDYLIKEPDFKSTGKYETALEAGIPILSANEFMQNMIQFIHDKGKEIKPLPGMSIQETIEGVTL